MGIMTCTTKKIDSESEVIVCYFHEQEYGKNANHPLNRLASAPPKSEDRYAEWLSDFERCLSSGISKQLANEVLETLSPDIFLTPPSNTRYFGLLVEELGKHNAIVIDHVFSKNGGKGERSIKVIPDQSHKLHVITPGARVCLIDDVYEDGETATKIFREVSRELGFEFEFVIAVLVLLPYGQTGDWQKW